MATALNYVSDPIAGLASPHEFRNRRLPAKAGEADEAYEPLAGVMRELSREQAADGVLVAWHTDEHSPTLLFASGACEPQSPAERAMLEAACDAAATDGADAVRWAPPGRGPVATALLTTRIAASGGIITVTTLFRRVGGSAKQGAREAATRMLPMVQGFFRLWSLRARTLATSRGLTAALNSSAVATLLVDAAGHLLFANSAAERLLASGSGLRRAGTMLSGTRLADTMRLHASIEHVTHEHDIPAPVLALARDHGRPLLAAVLPANLMASAPGDAAAIVHVFDPDHDLEPLLAPVCRLYGLSPVEGRLASLLARGMALGDAAKVIRVQEQTARSYLKQVFLKTDTNRQAELVWPMLKSAVRTAPECPTRFV